MTVYLTDESGAVWRMPKPIRWEIERTDGEPCDAATFVFCDDAGHREALEYAKELTAAEDSTARFTGIVDEVILTADSDGQFVTVNARGLAAKMMRYELQAAQYAPLSREEAISRFVLPCGIEKIKLGAMETVERMTVSTGMSCWRAFSGFCRRSAGALPRFTADGTLTAGTNGEVWALTDKTPILSLRRTAARCRKIGRQEMVSCGGVVTDAADGTGEARCVAVQTEPSAYGAAWQTAQELVDEAEKKASGLQVTMAGTMDCEPGDFLAVVMPKLGLSAAMTVRSVVHRGGENGQTVTVTAEGAGNDVAV